MIDINSKIPEIEKELERIDVELLVQEHRPLKIFKRLIRRKQLYPNSPARQSAVIWAALSSLIFSPTTVAAGGAVAGIVTAALLFWQTSIMSESNRIALASITPVDRVTCKIESATLSSGSSPLVLKVTFANEGTRAAYVDDIYGISLHSVNPGVSPTRGYYAIKLVTADNRVLEPKNFRTISFQLVSDDVGFASQEPREREPSEPISELAPIHYPVISDHQLDRIPTKIDSSDMLNALLRISIRHMGSAEHSTGCALRFTMSGTMSGTDGESAVGFRTATGGVWPSDWTVLTEGGFNPKADNFNRYSEEMRRNATMPTFSEPGKEAEVKPIPLIELGRQRIIP